MSTVEKSPAVRSRDWIDHGLAEGETLKIVVIDREGKETNLLVYLVGGGKYLRFTADWKESTVP